MGDAAEKLSANNKPYNGSANLVHWPPGVSGNPSGRPKGSIGLARYIREQTKDGQELVDYLLSVIRGELNKWRREADKLVATNMLLNRMLGAVELLEDDGQHKSAIDWSLLTESQRTQLLAIRTELASIIDRVRSDQSKQIVQ